MKTCPDCAEEVQEDARICRFCRHEFPSPALVDEVRSEMPSDFFCSGCGGPQQHDSTDICQNCGRDNSAERGRIAETLASLRQSRSVEMVPPPVEPLPYVTQRTEWEANPYGLSGRMIRGYRHWRRKR
jgi:predicted amidophosphoribosyltransferase